MNLRTLFQEFDIGLFISYLSGILGLFGLHQAYRYNYRKKLEAFWWKNLTLIDTTEYKNDALHLTFQSKPIEKLHQLKIFLKNGGNQVIKTSDIIGNIKIVFEKNVEILSYDVYSTNPHNSKFDVYVNGKELLFNFDFLEKKDYLRIDVLYKADKQSSGKVVGKIIEHPEISYKFSTDSNSRESYASIKYSNNIQLLLIVFLILLGCEFLIAASMLHLSMNEIKLFESYMNKPRLTSDYIFSILFILFLVLIPAWISFKLEWIIKPFFVTIDEIKTWYKKTNL